MPKTKAVKIKEEKVESPKLPAGAETPSNSKISYEDFSKVELKVGKILKAEDHPKADKLLILSVDFNEGKPRTIVAGLKLHYKKEELINKKAIFATNLAPVNLRGIESNGMVLAAVNDDDEHVVILQPEKDIEQGSKIR